MEKENTRPAWQMADLGPGEHGEGTWGTWGPGTDEWTAIGVAAKAWRRVYSLVRRESTLALLMDFVEY